MSDIHLVHSTREATQGRRSRLLTSAARAFAASGFKGASLRDIAADADVSLTLVDHHFGSKEQLLLAVVASHHEACKTRMVGFRAALAVRQQPASLAQLTAVWVRHEFELCNSEEGAGYLLFLVKLMNDQQIDSGIRETLDCSAPIVLNALALAAPIATLPERASAFILARGGLHASILDCTLAMEAGLIDEVASAIDFATAFIFAGLNAALH